MCGLCLDEKRVNQEAAEYLLYHQRPLDDSLQL